MNKLFKLRKHPYRNLGLTLLFCVVVACLISIAPSVSALSETARSASSFIDSIGVNTHLYYDKSVYHQKYHEIIKPKLQELGVRHIRDGGTRNLNGYLDRLKELKQLGIGATLIFDPRGGTPQQGVQLIKELGNVVEAAEGPNEYDLSGDANWVSVLRAYMQQLYQSVKSDSQTQNLPVLGPSFTSPEAYQAVGELGAYLDYSVLHNYFAGHHPGTPGWGGGGYGSIDYALNLARQNAGSKTAITTETGYHNAINTQDGHRPIPEKIARKYIPRMYLEQFNHGIFRTFSYELIDINNNPQRELPHENFGLLRNNGSAKPAFINLRDLINLLKDSGAQFTPSTLNYSLVGDTTNIHHTLLQKSDGEFYLILWQEVAGFDLNSKQEIVVPPKKIKLVVNKGFTNAKVYLLNKSLTLVNQYTNPTSFKVNVPDFLTIVELNGNSIAAD